MLENRKPGIWISERWALKAQIQIWVECDTTITNNLAHHVLKRISSVSLVTKSCLTVCNPMDCSTPGFPVHHQLQELAQTHVPQVGVSIQPSHSLLFPSPLTFILSQNQGFSKESVLHIRWLEYWSSIFSISPSNENSGLISFGIDWLDLLAVQGTLKSLLQYQSSKHQFFVTQLSLSLNSHIHTWLLEKL